MTDEMKNRRGRNPIVARHDGVPRMEKGAAADLLREMIAFFEQPGSAAIRFTPHPSPF